ncbi:MAG: DUF3795 domain-containing protein [bacterium]
MDNMTGYCGFNCFTCSVRIATINNDRALKQKIIDKFQKLNKNPYVIPTFTECVGCKTENTSETNDLKKSGCGGSKPNRKCEIATCASDRNCATCGECISYYNCNIVTTVHQL